MCFIRTIRKTQVTVQQEGLKLNDLMLNEPLSLTDGNWVQIFLNGKNFQYIAEVKISQPNGLRKSCTK